jgi:2,3-bisphosphoglycerate-independent phosphoglycerate mutase
MTGQRKVLFLFLDGVGLGQDDPQINPFAGTCMPHTTALLGGHPLVADGFHSGNQRVLANTERATLLGVDARLGVDGLPQSATGQAALLTGKNVPAWLGEHEGPKPTQPIMQLLGQGTVFTNLHQIARKADLLNAYPPRYFDSIERGYHLPGVIAFSARQAGIPLKTKDDLFQGNALSADFSGEGWRTHLGYADAPLLNIQQAAERFSSLAEENDLTIFEYWLTDVAGHHQDWQTAESILKTLDEVIASLDQHMADDHHLVLITSDHGNLEDMRTRHHTQNDVPLLLIGPQLAREAFLEALDMKTVGLRAGNHGAQRNLHGCRRNLDLTDIAPAMVRFIG